MQATSTRSVTALETSIVFYRDHQLTPLTYPSGRFACRVQAPNTNTILHITPTCGSAGKALVTGQLWVMETLGCSPTTPIRKVRVKRRYRTPELSGQEDGLDLTGT